MKEGKTTLAEIKRRYPFENTVLADIAEVNPIVIHRMLTGQPVERFQAEEVLGVLSMITEENYSLDTVDVVLYSETVTLGPGTYVSYFSVKMRYSTVFRAGLSR